MMLSDFFDMQMTAWLAAIGYSLCYGTIVAKMFRVFYIFRNPTENKGVCFSSFTGAIKYLLPLNFL